MQILIKNQTIEFDDEDLDLISRYRWWLHKGVNTNYVRGCLHNATTRVYMHRLITGVVDKTKDIDHIDGNGLNNKKLNLRICSRSTNNHNRKNVKGYWYDKKSNKYRAELWLNGIKINAGRFNTESEARRAYLMKKKELLGLDFTQQLEMEQILKPII